MTTLTDWFGQPAARGDRFIVTYLLEAGPVPRVGAVSRVLDLRPGVEVDRVDRISDAVYNAHVLILEAGQLGPRLGRWLVEGSSELRVMHVHTAGTESESMTTSQEAADRIGHDVDAAIVGAGRVTERVTETVASSSLTRPIYVLAAIVLVAIVLSLLK